MNQLSEQDSPSPMDIPTQQDSSQVSTKQVQIDLNLSTKRRSRRPLPRSSSGTSLVGLVNAVILAVGLTVILASRCDDMPSTDAQQGSWLDHFVTPKDLHLPPSVTDKIEKPIK